MVRGKVRVRVKVEDCKRPSLAAVYCGDIVTTRVNMGISLLSPVTFAVTTLRGGVTK
jgi:hypothetical protein